MSSPSDQPAPGSPTPPREPFASISKQGGLFAVGIREPWMMLLFFAVFFVVGIVFFRMAKSGSDSGAEGAMAVSVLILVVFCGLGVVGMVIAAVRLRWKAEYVRVMGRSPWV
ncbi:MAG: hypothetical protein ABI112_00955 [Terracoccus sp.]